MQNGESFSSFLRRPQRNQPGPYFLEISGRHHSLIFLCYAFVFCITNFSYYSWLLGSEGGEPLSSSLGPWDYSQWSLPNIRTSAKVGNYQVHPPKVLWDLQDYTQWVWGPMWCWSLNHILSPEALLQLWSKFLLDSFVLGLEEPDQVVLLTYLALCSGMNFGHSWKTMWGAGHQTRCCIISIQAKCLNLCTVSQTRLGAFNNFNSSYMLVIVHVPYHF